MTKRERLRFAWLALTGSEKEIRSAMSRELLRKGVHAHPLGWARRHRRVRALSDAEPTGTPQTGA